MDVCHTTSWETSFSPICCHSSASMHVCICVCAYLQLTVCIFEHDKRYDTEKQSDGGRQRQSQATNHVISVSALCYMLCGILMKSCVSFPVCISLLVHWVWLSWSHYKTVTHRPLCACLCVCFLFVGLHEFVSTYACTPTSVHTYLCMLSICICVWIHSWSMCVGVYSL